MSKITIDTLVAAPAATAWEVYNDPDHITQWNQANADWHCPSATNDLRVGGRLVSRMEAKDGSMGFDFEGTYEAVEPNERLVYTLDDGRKVETTFVPEGDGTRVTTVFDAEESNPEDMQRMGWQAILDSYKAHVER